MVDKGDPLLEWSGARVLNGKGVARRIRTYDEIVFEYLRRVLSKPPITFGFSTQLKQPSWQELVTIWYRHRNCLVHRGGCRPQNASHCDRGKPDFVKCRDARNEMTAKYGAVAVDEYAAALETVVVEAVRRELA